MGKRVERVFPFAIGGRGAEQICTERGPASPQADKSTERSALHSIAQTGRPFGLRAFDDPDPPENAKLFLKSLKFLAGSSYPYKPGERLII
jgi:hypothetical protein